MVRKILSASKSLVSKKPKPGSNVGYDNPRENIDPHIKTRAISTQEAKIGPYTMPKVDGANTEVLTTDGAGTVSWAAGGGGAGDVTAAVNLTDETIIQGDGGAKGVKTSTATVAQVAANVAHVAGDGSDHADVATNSTHVAGDGSDHADVATNTAASHAQNTDTAVAANTITLAMMAHGTDGNLITYDAAGAPAHVATGTDTHVLTSNGAGTAPTFQAAAGGGNCIAVAQNIVAGAAVTSIQFTNLDLDTDECYMVIATVHNPTGTGSNVALFYNADTTATNYYRQYIYCSSTTIGAARQNNAFILDPFASKSSTATIWIKADAEGYIRAYGCQEDKDPAECRLMNLFTCWTGTANATTITFTASVANSIGIGSNITLYKVKYA